MALYKEIMTGYGVPATYWRVEGIAIPDEWNAETIYPIAVLTSSPNPAAAGAFVDFVLSPAGRAILGAHSFLEP